MDPILIIDDEKDNLEALKRLLRTQYKVTVLDSPLEALKLIQKEGFNIIISDQRMPEMTGVEFLEKAKTICPQTTRILLTGYTDIEAVIDAINRGNIYRYLAKPWDPEDLKITLRQANEAYKLRKELEQKNIALTSSNEELKKALSELEVLDRSKARFLSLVSHELNTPLTVLTSFLSLLLEKQHTLPGEVQKAITSISKASDRFNQIVSEVITFVKLESDTALTLETLDLEEETVTLVHELEGERRKKQVNMRLKTVKRPVIECDADKFRVALRYFLADAIKRSQQGKDIVINISKSAGEMVYSLARTGETLSSEALKPLEPSADILHHGQNLGLSLAICRLVVERHNGKMILDSSNKKQTVVSLHLKGI